MLLRQHMRDRDLVAKEPDGANNTVHARFGGDEVCFLIADLADVQQIHTICRRFSEAVSGYDWVAVDGRLAERPVRVDIGVACLDLGRWPIAVCWRRALRSSSSSGATPRCTAPRRIRTGERKSSSSTLSAAS